MIPKGSIFVRLRHRALDFYPEDSKILYKNRLNFADWLVRGSYLPLSVKNSEIIFEASPQDLASIFLSEIEYLSNNCFEHLQECLCFSSDTRVRSDAWNIVTIYYFAFFVAQALVRLLGKPLMYLNKEVLKLMAATAGQSSVPNAGIFLLEKTDDLSFTSAKYRLKLYRKRFHEGTWKVLFGLLTEALNEVTSSKDPIEPLFYQSITTKKLFKIYTDYQWPAFIRNRANYVPGFAYLLVENKLAGKTKRLIDELNGCDENDIPKILDFSVLSCSKEKAKFSDHVSLLHNLAHSLFLLHREIYFELIIRRRLDKRMELKRKSFMEKMAISEDASFPFISSL